MSDFDLLVGHLEGLTVTQGPLRGESFPVMPWQRSFLRNAWQVGVSGLSVARGAGKSTLFGAVADAHLRGPLCRPREEVVIAGPSFTQARIIFRTALAFGGEVYFDRGRYKLQDSEQKALIECRETGASIRAIGANPRMAHGLQASLVLLDEPAQLGPSGEGLVAALTTGDGKLDDQRVIALGTRAASPDHWFERWLNGNADYSKTYAARPNDPLFQRRTWERANPSLRHLPALLPSYRAAAEKAKRDPALLQAFKALKLNMGVSDTVVNVLLSAEVWAEIEGDAVRAGPFVLGLDLGGTGAMSAAAAFWPQTGRLECFALVGDIPDLGSRGLQDGVGGLYREMARRGELGTVPGRVVPPAALVAAAVDRWGVPARVVADRFKQGEMEDAYDKARLPRSAGVEWRGQGYRDGAEDVRRFRQAALSGRVVPVESLLGRAAMGEARVVVDPSGNEKLSKNSEAGRRKRGRDDAAAAMVLAVASAERTPPTRPRQRLRTALAG